MGRIILLDEHTANKIAAGEVVERPASVVKELVENSIDAGSTRIEISITEGGLKEIVVSDNGCGMDAADARIAFDRHATSKIKTADDLDHIITLGFRGEALASIASVSKLSLKTKTQESIAGTEVTIEGGKFVSITETGCPDGTVIRINDIFFNTPARKKHMKSPLTEAGHVSDIVNKIAMGYPRISFQLKVNNRVVFKTSGGGSLQECIASIYGPELAREMLSVSSTEEPLVVNGFVGKPSLTRSGRTHQVIYINGRYVKDRFISQSVEKAFHSMLMTGRFPVFVLHISANPEMVDVNVHPAKTVVRIAESQSLEDFVFEAVKQALSANSLIPKSLEVAQKKHNPLPIVQEELKISGFTPLSQKNVAEPLAAPQQNGQPESAVEDCLVDISAVNESTIEYTDAHTGNDLTAEHYNVKNDARMAAEREAGYETGNEAGCEAVEDSSAHINSGNDITCQESPAAKAAFPELRPIGQINNTYIVAQGIDGMLLIDQHAAHERVLYEKYMSRPGECTTSVQLLFPETVQLTHQEAQFLIEAINAFTDLGFVIEEFGGNSFLLRAVPVSVSHKNIKEIFLGLLDYFSRNRYTISGKALEEKFIITMACKNAIKANHRLGFPEMEALLEQLADTDQPYTCPHGRPTITHFSGYDLEKMFKRVL